MKKSWHVLTYENQEKVFLARQKAEQEKKRLLEIQKQLREERQMEDLRKIQVEAGLIPYSERLDWMYEGVVQSADAEDYLLGKPVDDKAEKESELNKLKSKTGSLLSNSSDALPSSRDQISKLKEDPLLTMRRKEMEQRSQMLKNPLNKQKLLERLEKEIAATGTSKHDKMERKLEKKLKKLEKLNKAARHRSRSRSQSPERKRPRLQYPEHPTRPLAASAQSDGRSSSHNPNTSRRSKPPSLTPEERQRRLQEMEQDAKTNEQNRSQRLKRYERDDRAEQNSETKRTSNPNFMAHVNSSTYLESKDTVYDKIKRGAHTRQRSSDSFLRRD